MKANKKTATARKTIKRIGVFLFACLPLAGFAYLDVGTVVPQNIITTPFSSSQCIATSNQAVYEGQQIRISNTNYSASNTSREFFPSTNVKVYNPYNAIGDQVSTNTLGGLVPPFTYFSNGKPGTNHFNLGVQTVYIYKQANPSIVVNPSPAHARASVARQLAHEFYRKEILGMGGSSSYTMTFVPYNTNIPQTLTANPNNRSNMIADTKCQNFYVGYCGDGVLDNANQPGNTLTDGKNGILVNGGIVSWVSTGFAAEVCNDGNNVDGDGCNATCSGTGAGGYCGDSIINDGVSGSGHGPIYFSGGVEMIEECDVGELNGSDLCTSDCAFPVIDQAVDEAVNE